MSNRAQNAPSRKCGTVVTEFFILAPILLLLVYVAYSLNNFIEYRQTAAIAARNAANSIAYDENEDKQKAMLSRVVAEEFSDHSAAGSDTRMRVIKDDSILDNSDAAKTTTLAAEKRFGSISGKSNGDRLTALKADDEIKDISNPLGAATKAGTLAFDAILNQKVDVAGDSFNLLLDDRVLTTEVTLAIPAQKGLIERSIVQLANFWRTKDFVTGQPEVVYAASYQRVQSAYHTNSYRAQGLIGVIFGLSTKKDHNWGANNDGLNRPLWSDFKPLPGNYTTECMMNLRGGEDCRNPGRLVKLLDVVAVVKAVICVVADIVGEAACTSAGNVGNLALDELYEQIVNQFTTEAKKKVTDAISKKANEMKQDIIDTAKTKVEDELKKNVEKSMEKMNENLPRVDEPKE
jgi:hypothetical protein